MHYKRLTKDLGTFSKVLKRPAVVIQRDSYIVSGLAIYYLGCMRQVDLLKVVISILILEISSIHSLRLEFYSRLTRYCKVTSKEGTMITYPRVCYQCYIHATQLSCQLYHAPIAAPI